MSNKLQNADKKTLFNTIMLYVLAIAKIIFPLLTLPFLTRTLSVACYGAISYVKSITTYAQAIIDFGFIFSSVKDIVKAQNKDKVSGIVGDTILAKLLLSIAAFVLIIVISVTVPIIQNYKLLLFLSFVPPLLSAFLLDFFFRGIEKMHIVSLVFVSMKTISTVLTISLVRNDSQVLLVPLFDIISSVVAILLSWFIFVKLGYKIKCGGIKKAVKKIKESCFYFTNSVASSAFGALNTAVIGMCIEDLEQIAFWSVSMQLVGAVQTMYTPLSNGIYPYMIKSKNLTVIKKILLVFVPLVICGTVLAGILSPVLLTIVSGEKYRGASVIFNYLLPVLVFSFPVAILGWPTLGCIDKVKEINISTITGAFVQIIGLAVLLVCGQFYIINIAILRNISEITMCMILVGFTVKYRTLFKKAAEVE